MSRVAEVLEVSRSQLHMRESGVGQAHRAAKVDAFRSWSEIQLASISGEGYPARAIRDAFNR